MSASAVPTNPTSPTARHTYRPDIDGLRAIAILSVVLHHAGLPFLSGGFTGVNIFFVISGYLIGGQIYAEVRSGSFSYLRFYQRRARRILPAFYAVLLFTIAAALVLLSPAELRLLSRDAFAATLSASNIAFWRFANYFDARSTLHPLLMTWSLGVEEQFYLVIPLLIVLLGRIRPRLVLPVLLGLCLVSLLLATRDVALAPMQAFYLLPDRAWELGVGVALAVFELNRRARPDSSAQLAAPLKHIAAFAGFALILAPLFLLSPSSPFPGPTALPSVLGTAILIALPTSIVNRRILSLPPLASIGRVSYSWYLWHWPLLSFLRITTTNALPVPKALLAITAAFVLAVLSWRFIEQPFRRSTTPVAPLLRRYAALSLASLAVCAALYLARGLPQRYPDLARTEALADALPSDPCLAKSQDKPNLSPACFPPRTPLPIQTASPTPIVALWGDSHAAALAPGLRTLANARGYSFAELAKNSCTPLIGVTHFIPRLPSLAAQCLAFNRATLALIQSDPRIQIVVLTASWSAPLERTSMDGWLAPDPNFESAPNSAPASPSGSVPTAQANLRLYQSALAATIQALQSAGKRVILVQDAPSFAIDPVLRVSTVRIPARLAIAQLLKPADNATLIDPAFSPPESSPSITTSIDLLKQASQQHPTHLRAQSSTQAPAQLPAPLPLTLFDPKPALCPTPNQCNYRDAETLLFIDNTHLSAAGASRALAAFPLPAADAVRTLTASPLSATQTPALPTTSAH